MNQSDDTKDAKKKSAQLSGDLNMTHKRELLKQHIYPLSQKIQKKMQPVTSISLEVDKNALIKLNEEFDNLIEDTNQLAEETKKLVSINMVPYKARYEAAKQKVPLRRCLLPDLDNAAEIKDKIFFLALEKALDNTAIINAQIHEATLFKVGVLYNLYNQDILKRRIVEMSIALREDDLPDRFKYIKKKGQLREAKWIELGEQAYKNNLNHIDAEAQRRFDESCKKFMMVYEGIEWPVKNSEVGEIDTAGIKFAEVPDALSEVLSVSNPIFYKQSEIAYFNFTGNELATLQFLIPDHKKNTVFIPEIGGIVLAGFMRECLSKQILPREIKESALRKRTAADKFKLKACRILSEANAAMENDKIGKIVDPHAGYVSFSADPDHIVNEIKREYKQYRAELLITEVCQLSGRALVNEFFEKAIKTLNLCSEKESKHSEGSFKTVKEKSTFFKKDPLSFYKQEAEQIERKYQLFIQEMQNFKKLVEDIGAEHIKIFAAGPGGKASYSIPKVLLLNDKRLTVTSSAVQCQRSS